MNDSTCIVTFIAAYAAGSLVTNLYILRKVSIWRIKCITLEHDLARAVGRPPRSIEDI